MLKPEYRDYQVTGDQYWKSTDRAGLLWEMRLGKTLVVTRASYEMGDFKSLVIAPISAMDGWEKELRREGISYVRAYALPKTKRIDAFKHAMNYEFPMWTLVNYDAMRSDPRLASLPFDRVILDESTTIKNPKANITKLCLSNFNHIKRRGILTGAVQTESTVDVFCQMKFMRGHFMGCTSFWDFRERYFEPDFTGFNWLPKKGMADKIRLATHSSCSVLRRCDVKQEVKSYVTKRVQMNPAQARMYKKVEDEFAYEVKQLGQYEDVETCWATTRFIWLRRIAGGFSPHLELLSTAKPDLILDVYAHELLGQQIVIQYALEAELDFDYSYFKEKGISCSFAKGVMTVENRRKHLDNFRNGHSRFLLVMEKWGNGQQGQDFSMASTMFYRSNERSALLRMQSEDRLAHPLKNDTNLYIDVVCEGTVDEDGQDNIFQKVFSAREMMTNFENRRLNKEIFCTPEQTPSLFEEIA